MIHLKRQNDKEVKTEIIKEDKKLFENEKKIVRSRKKKGGKE